MLAAKVLPEILKDSLGDGIEGIVLMTSEGSLLSSSFLTNKNQQSINNDTNNGIINEISLAAIASSIWGNYHECTNDIFLHIIKLENGCIGISTAGKGYLIAVYGRESSIGLVKNRLQTLNIYFSKVFEQIK